MKKLPILLLLCLLLSGCATRDAKQVREDHYSLAKNSTKPAAQTVKEVSADETTGESTQTPAAQTAENAGQTLSGQEAAAAGQDQNGQENAKDLQTTAEPESAEAADSSGEGADDLDAMDASRDDLTKALKAGLSRLIDARDVVAVYCLDEDAKNRDEMLDGVNKADELIGRIDAEDITALPPSQVAAYFDEMADVMDVLTKVKDPTDLTKVDEEQLREALVNSMWIDDDINTYMFDKNGKNMYLALAGDDKPFGGTYSIEVSRGSIVFTFTIPNLKTEVKADVTRFDDQAFCFTDINTGDEFYLMPVKWKKD